MVLAVPMTPHVPDWGRRMISARTRVAGQVGRVASSKSGSLTVEASSSFRLAMSSMSMVPALYWAQLLRQSVQAPTRVPRKEPGHHGAGDEMDGRLVRRDGAHELGRRCLVAACMEGRGDARPSVSRPGVAGGAADWEEGGGKLCTSDQHHGVDGLGPDHLLRVHAHQVAEEHARGRGERLVQADGGEVDG